MNLLLQAAADANRGDAVDRLKRPLDLEFRQPAQSTPALLPLKAPVLG